MNKKKISVIILDFLKSKRVVENVKNLQKQKGDFEMEIIIIDNSCNKENAEKLKTLEVYENVKLIFNEANLGYTKANNKAAKLANGDYLFITNPDIIVRDEEAFEKLLKFMEANKDIAILGTKQIDESNNELGITVRAFPKLWVQIARRSFLKKLPFFKKAVEYDEMRHLDLTKTQEVDWLQSSFVVISKDFWDQVGGLCEDYFLFMSDPEICWQAWKLGKKVVFYPDVTVYADGLRASKGGPLQFFKSWTMRQHLKDSIRYRLKRLFKRSPRLR